MSLMDYFTKRPADIGKLKESRDVPALIRFMNHTDPKIRRQAVASLAASGTPAVPALVDALSSPKARVRLGATEALGTIRDPRAVRPLLSRISCEKYVELRYASVIALGEIGSTGVVPDLVCLLGDQNKFIRYAAAFSLEKLGWDLPDEPDRLRYLIARQDWDAVRNAGPAAVQPLCAVLQDPDPDTRSRIATLLGDIGAGEGGTACESGLKDRDPHVRWSAVLAAMNCGIRHARLPPFVAARERTGPDPVAAAVLNFLFLGIGYNYIGKWWGFPVFMTYMSILVLAQLAIGPVLPYLLAYPVTAVLGLHTYYLARRMSDL